MKSPSLLLLIGALFVATVWGQTRRTTRHYRHSSAELALTNEVLIDQADCGPEETAIFVHSAATSSGTYHERRMVIRRTWAQEATANQMRVIFVLGRPRSESPTEQAKLKAEADKYNDIMQFGFEDSYYNLTLKVIGELKWAERHCNSSRYIVKADDDAILNVRMLSQLVQNSKIPSGFTGMSYHTPAYRRPGYKWYMPQRFYTQNSYQFLLGFSYILSTDKVTPLLETLAAYSEPILDIDDVFVTGVLADRAKIKRHNSSRFRFYCGLDSCVLETSLAVTCSDGRLTERMYQSWKNANIERCYANYGFARDSTFVPRGF